MNNRIRDGIGNFGDEGGGGNDGDHNNFGDGGGGGGNFGDFLEIASVLFPAFSFVFTKIDI